MIDSSQIDDIAKKLFNSLPSGVQSVQKDIEKNFRAALQSTFTKLDLVSREEFDVQTAVLARTRSRLEALEAQVKVLEESLSKEK